MKLLLKIGFAFLILSALISCDENEQESQVQIVTGNVTYNSIIQSSGDDYFVLDQNKIRLLNLTSPNSLNISSTFPLTDIDFESVRGNADTLYIQSKTGLQIFVLRNDGETRWEQTTIIEDVLACDKFDVQYPFLLTSVRNQTCNFSENASTELRLYDLTKLDSVVLKSAVATSEILKVQKAENTRGFYALSSVGQISFFTQNTDATNLPEAVLDYPAANNFAIYANRLIVTGSNQISQYSLVTPTNAQLLSNIPVSE